MIAQKANRPTTAIFNEPTGNWKRGTEYLYVVLAAQTAAVFNTTQTKALSSGAG